jgi:hypothetical protein
MRTIQKISVDVENSNPLGSVGISRPRRRGRFISPLLNDPDPVDVILLSHELFRGDHELIEVVHDTERGADTDAEVPREIET